MPFFVYILASKRNGTLYIGATNDLARCVAEHKAGAIPGFTKRYGVACLDYYEAYDDLSQALQRERNLKCWRRAWKIALIEETNPQWRDLRETISA